MSQKTNRPGFRSGVRVKRWGKSPPPVEQSGGQDKPNPVQDRIGDRAARSYVPGKSHAPGAAPLAGQINECPGSFGSRTESGAGHSLWLFSERSCFGTFEGVS